MIAPKIKHMKKTFSAVVLSVIAVVVAGCASAPHPAAKTAGAPVVKTSASTNAFDNEKSKVSYAVGMVFGHNLQQQGIDVDGDELLRGLKDEQAGGATLLTPQAAQAAITNYQAKARAEISAKNKADGEAFLATNKTNPGVITLPDGLQYKIIAEGTGATPTPDATVTVNYRGTFLDGKEFDNSTRAGHPAQLKPAQVIRGWAEALMKMKVGAKWQLFISPGLAYGAAGRAPFIPPNATLIFEVELLDTQNPPPPAPAPAPAVSPSQPLTSDIVAVPSAEEISQGKKPYTIKQEDIEKMQSQKQTN
jgi:FKBP-type peptidyl-prolyl cis-trans isomerase FklB